MIFEENLETLLHSLFKGLYLAYCWVDLYNFLPQSRPNQCLSKYQKKKIKNPFNFLQYRLNQKCPRTGAVRELVTPVYLTTSILYSLWFDLTRNRTQVYRVSSRCYIHSITDSSLQVPNKVGKFAYSVFRMQSVL